MQHLLLLKDTRKAQGLLKRREIENMIVINTFTSFYVLILINNIGL